MTTSEEREIRNSGNGETTFSEDKLWAYCKGWNTGEGVYAVAENFGGRYLGDLKSVRESPRKAILKVVDRKKEKLRIEEWVEGLTRFVQKIPKVA